MVTSIATVPSTSYNGTIIYPSGRHIDTDSTGKRWAAIRDGSYIRFYYASDPTGTWTLATGNVYTYAASIYSYSFFIDVDDGFHLAYIGASNVSFNYRYGTEAAGTITWSGAQSLDTSYSATSIDMVAHKLGSDYWAHCFASTSGGVRYRSVKITGGVPTPQGTATTLTSYGNRTVSCDFRHTGDGKTVASSSPDVFFASVYSSSSMHFAKLTYAAGPSWTIGTVTTMSSTVTASSGNGALAFDGTAVMMSFWHTNNAGVYLLERDAADTTTTSHSQSSDPGNALYPVIVWDSNRNLYFAGVESGSSDPMWTKWTRATTTWDGSWTTIEATSGINTNVGAIRHHRSSAVEVIYSRNLATDDVAWAEAVALNVAPTAPTWSAPADGSTQDVAATLLLDWVFNDPDPGDTQSAYTLRHRVGTGSYEYWNGSSWQATEDASTKIASTGTSQTLAASWGNDGDADHYFAVKTWDAVDAGPSPWATELRIVPSAVINPTLDAPLNLATVGPSETASWTVTSQSKYRVVVSDTSSTSNMDAGTLDDDTGLVVDAGARSVAISFPTNSVTRYVRLQTTNAEGLASDIQQVQVSVSYTPPSVPTIVMTPTTAAVAITVTNPGTGATEISNDVYRRDTGDTGDGIRVATGVAVDGAFIDYSVASGKSYEYRARAFGDNGTSIYGAWT